MRRVVSLHHPSRTVYNDSRCKRKSDVKGIQKVAVGFTVRYDRRASSKRLGQTAGSASFNPDCSRKESRGLCVRVCVCVCGCKKFVDRSFERSLVRLENFVHCPPTIIIIGNKGRLVPLGKGHDERLTELGRSVTQEKRQNIEEKKYREIVRRRQVSAANAPRRIALHARRLRRRPPLPLNNGGLVVLSN